MPICILIFLCALFLALPASAHMEPYDAMTTPAVGDATMLAVPSTQVVLGPLPLPPYSPPPRSRQRGDTDSRAHDRDLCNDGQSFLTGHWKLGIFLCALGFGCGLYALWQLDESIASIVRSFGYWLLYLVLFGFGIYGIISTTFQDCAEQPSTTRAVDNRT